MLSEKTKTLNLLSSSEEELRAAFDALEGQGFYNASKEGRDGFFDTVATAFRRFKKMGDEKTLDKIRDNCPVSRISGRGGSGHAYHVYKDGRIVFRNEFCNCGGEWHPSPREVGFEIK